MSPITAAPMIRKDVPSKAVRMRKMKKAGRFGARAVPMEQQVKRKAVMMETWFLLAKTP
jgi:formiminotetrahydrofolate cyclodeaminase